MIMVKSWEDVAACGCHACQGMHRIRERCVELNERLAVWDCRMFSQGFRICDTDRVFVAPACEGVIYATPEDAAAAVLAKQKHCDAFLSSWPLRPHGNNDFVWVVKTFA